MFSLVCFLFLCSANLTHYQPLLHKKRIPTFLKMFNHFFQKTHSVTLLSSGSRSQCSPVQRTSATLHYFPTVPLGHLNFKYLPSQDKPWTGRCTTLIFHFKHASVKTAWCLIAWTTVTSNILPSKCWQK